MGVLGLHAVGFTHELVPVHIAVLLLARCRVVHSPPIGVRVTIRVMIRVFKWPNLASPIVPGSGSGLGLGLEEVFMLGLGLGLALWLEIG